MPGPDCESFLLIAADWLVLLVESRLDRIDASINECNGAFSPILRKRFGPALLEDRKRQDGSNEYADR
jgi:hypothetical protein